MRGYSYNTTDRLALYLYATGNPWERGDVGLVPFFDALEAYAGQELMPTQIQGKRNRKYTRAAFAKACAEDWRDDFGAWVTVERAPSPQVKLTVKFSPRLSYSQFALFFSVLPFAFFEEPGREVERSQRIIELARAWASHYPVTYAVAHDGADFELSDYTNRTNSQALECPPEARDWTYTAFWLMVFGKEVVDALGRSRVLSTPAHRVEELPNGAVLIVTRPTVADWASEEARRAQARALVHLRPDFDFDEVLRQLSERSAALSPVEPRFDPDLESLLHRVVDRAELHQRQRRIAELNAWRPAAVSEWLPVEEAPPSDVEDPEAALQQYAELAEELVIILHSKVPSVFEKTAEALSDVDYRFWFEKFPEFYERKKVEGRALPAAGAYLGEVLVKQLGGRWVPRRNREEAQVIVGDRAWLPFLRARRYMQTRQTLLDFSLIKLYREAERHRGGGRGA